MINNIERKLKVATIIIKIDEENNHCHSDFQIYFFVTTTTLKLFV
jgi:hypothetical protein